LSARKLYDQAVDLHLHGQLHTAMDIYNRLLEQNPDDARVLFMQGNALAQLGQYDLARRSLEKAINLEPQHAEWLNNLGIVNHSSGRYSAAIDALNKAIELDNQHLSSYLRLGIIYTERNEFDSAYTMLNQAYALNNHNITVLINLAILMEKQDEIPGAISYLERAFQIDDLHAETNLNLGNLYRQAGDYASAEKHLDTVLGNYPKYRALALTNYALIKGEQGLFGEALLLFENAINEDPACHAARWNKGLTNLLLGRFVEGWELYDAGFLVGQRPHLGLPIPRWDGKSTDGKLLVWMEQGIGDEIMFASCLEDLAQHHPNFCVYCDQRLIELFIRSFPQIDFESKEIAMEHGVSAEYTAQICAGNLGQLYRKKRENFPKKGYLATHTQSQRHWRQLLDQLPGKINIGISWRGGKHYAEKVKRSIPVETLVETFKNKNVNLISLQFNVSDEEKSVFQKNGITLVELGDLDLRGNIEPVAALISNLDLVISVDNTNAHLAGALGIPSWVLLPKIPDWRWLLNCDESHIYPNMSLFRQTTSGDWKAPLLRLEILLNTRLNTPLLKLGP